MFVGWAQVTINNKYKFYTFFASAHPTSNNRSPTQIMQ